MSEFSKLKSWPFKEANKLMTKINKLNKDIITFETGYGPSGLPPYWYICRSVKDRYGS